MTDSSELRRVAKERSEGAQNLLESVKELRFAEAKTIEELSVQNEMMLRVIQQLAMVVIGYTASAVDERAADVMDMVALRGDPERVKRLAVIRRNDAVRQAAANGDWDEFDKLVAGESDAFGGAAGGAPDSPGGDEAGSDGGD